MPRSTADTAGRQRVIDTLERDGWLLQQGQAEIASVADLLAGKPITTRGYSWDYVPAWRLADELAARDDVARIKLFRGRTTLVHRRLWAAVATIALAAVARARADNAAPSHPMLALIEATPGIRGGELRSRLALDARAFQRHKGRLEQQLCVFGIERNDGDAHTHESRWYPWAMSKIGTSELARSDQPLASAIATLLGAMPQHAAPLPRASTLLPALR